MLAGRSVLIGACGGIALYKVPLLISRLRDLGAGVHVAMTRSATEFVTPLTFQTVSGNPVHLDLFAAGRHWNVEHIALAGRTDLCVVAPATANFIGKLAAGVADDLLSTTMLALTCPVLIVPAMNSDMFRHPSMRRNLGILREWGYEVLEPDTGRLASGAVGPGRYPETERILAACLRLLGPGDLTGRRVVVTAGPTREFFDPVRFISNPSTGRMGYALAAEARKRGAKVVLISGPTQLSAPPEVELVQVITASEMHLAVLGRAETADAVIMAAAPADWTPAAPADRKVGKAEADLEPKLSLTPDILGELGRRKSQAAHGAGLPVLVGFAAETHDLLDHARAKLAAKNADLIVANSVSGDPEAGFASETNRVTILRPGGSVEELPLMPKSAVAEKILDHVAGLLGPAASLEAEGDA